MAAIALLSNFVLASPVLANDGFLDESFSGNGVLVLPLPPLVSGNAEAVSIKVQADGRIVVLANLASTGGGRGFLLYRLLPHGAPDPSFGTDGIVVIDPNLGVGGSELASDLEVQADGRIVVAGDFTVDLGDDDWMVGRFLSDGSFDPSFNGGLWRRIAFDLGADLHDVLGGMALDPSTGAIVVVGSAAYSGTRGFVAMARLTSSGALDPSFGVGGKSTGDFNPSATYSDSLAVDVLVEPDGSVVMAGTWNTRDPGYPGRWYWAISRLTPAGLFDPSFWQGGVRIGNFTGFDGTQTPAFFRRLARFSDGTYLAGGRYTSSVTGETAGLIRFETDGSYFGSWGVGGFSAVSYSYPTVDYSGLEGLAIDAADRAVCSGRHGFGPGVYVAGIARLADDGYFDPRYLGMGHGAFTFDPFASSNDEVAELVLDGNGRILVAGTVEFLQPPPINAIQKRVGVVRILSGLPYSDDFESGDFSGGWLAQGALP